MFLRLKSVVLMSLLCNILLVGCVPLRLIQLGDSKDKNDDQVKESAIEPAQCEVSGQSYGIVGGSVLGPGNKLSSSTVMVLSVDDEKRTSICTGTLIANNKVLSAAHCTSRYSGTVFIAFTNNMNCALKAPKRTLRKTVARAIHPDYSYISSEFSNSVNDMAVFKFEGGLPAGYTVRSLPSRSYTIQNWDTLVMTGYGVTSEGEGDSGTLRFTTTSASRVVSEFRMLESANSNDYKMKSSPRTIIVEQPYNGVCSGDSGGPLYVKDNGDLILLGLTSVGVDNLRRGTPKKSQVCHGVAIFADVREQLPWIYDQIIKL